MNNEGLTLNQLAERNAVLVSEVEKLRAERDQLAAENVTARNAVQVFCDVVGANTDAICEEVGPEGVRAILAAMSATGNMPATSDYLAGIKADGVLQYAENLDSAADDAERGGYDDAVKCLRSEASAARLFAAQLRKGAAK